MKNERLLPFVMLPLALAACGDSGGSSDSNTVDPDASVTPDAADTPEQDSQVIGGDAAPSPESDVGPTGDAGEADAAPEPPPGPFRVRGTLEQVYVWQAPVETPLELVAADGSVSDTGVTDTQGSLVFREVPPGQGYIVRVAAEPATHVEDVWVRSTDDLGPDPALYEQPLQPGYGYLTTRDGTKLSIFVTMPGPPENGPYPTVVTYSGYSPSRPGHLLSDAAQGFCGDFPILCDAPDDPNALIAGVLGYATVGVNMRGTGCSGGAYDYFEPLQQLDGYDVVETVAHQPWVLNGKVGLVGLSYPGITQLFVAQTQPPSLAAITPMSVIADSATSTLVPGGIYNSGFALAWIDNVLERAKPYGHQWVTDLVDAGDTTCEEHQLLHSQNLDVVAKALANPYYSDEVAKPVDPSSFVDRINVPVFLTGQWQDEQTGPHFATMLDKFTGAPVKRFFVTNGVHIDGLAPQNLMEWFIFLELYVAERVPQFDAGAASLVPVFFSQVFGAFVPLPENRFEAAPDFETAKAAYESEPSLRVNFETGTADGLQAGAPQAAFTQSFDAWPIPETVAQRWFLQPNGTLGDTAPVAADAPGHAFHHEPAAGDRTFLPNGGVEALQPAYVYPALTDDQAVAWTGAALDADTVMIGSGSVDLWLNSTEADADLEVNLTEIRPDGLEVLVQSGWLRASHRKLRDDATELRPVKSHYLADIEPIVPGEWTPLRVELMPFAHVFRAGSRVRVSVDTPGDSRAAWRFILLEQDGTAVHTIGNDAAHASSVVLPVIPNVDVPTPLPACNALRGQPCRPYTPLSMEPAVTPPPAPPSGG
jgi:predicted acyl esterase